MSQSSPIFFMVAGEQSGDLHGSKLIQSIKKLNPNIISFTKKNCPQLPGSLLTPKLIDTPPPQHKRFKSWPNRFYCCFQFRFVLLDNHSSLLPKQIEAMLRHDYNWSAMTTTMTTARMIKIMRLILALFHRIRDDCRIGGGVWGWHIHSWPAWPGSPIQSVTDTSSVDKFLQADTRLKSHHGDWITDFPPNCRHMVPPGWLIQYSEQTKPINQHTTAFF